MLSMVLIGSLLWCAGCQMPGIEDDTVSGLELRGMRTPDGPLLAADVLPRLPSMREYRITAGLATGRVILQSIERTDEHGAIWAINEDGSSIEYWGMDDGNLVLPVVIDYEDRAISVFDPPLILVYEQMPHGEQWRQEVQMQVLDTRDPSRVVQQGTARRTIEYIHDQMIHTPLGERLAHRLAIHFHVTLDTTSIERTSTLFIVPGVGLIGEEARERVRVTNLIDRDQRQTIVLTWISELEEDSQ